jgi:hypothetical protein
MTVDGGDDVVTWRGWILIDLRGIVAWRLLLISARCHSQVLET